MKRRTVHKITPASENSFDQQFWPVLVALTVLSGISMGAVLTTLHGPWMWGSLSVLMLFVTITIFLLFNLDNSRLRRSLQFAIISSLALILLILVFASIINIFQNPDSPTERQVAQRRVRTIEISDQQASFVWQETNARPTPEPQVEMERQTKPSTNVRPQPVPVEESKPEVNPQLVRREITAESIPRQNPELSQLKRQTRDLQPQSSIPMTGEKVAVSTMTTRIKSQPLVEPTQPETIANSPNSEDFDTDLEKPAFVSNLTVVKKPVIAPPASIEKALASDAIKKVLRKQQRDRMLPHESSIQPVAIRPDLVRTVKPAAPTMTKPVVAPLTSVEPKPTEPTSVEAKPTVAKAEPKVADRVAMKPATPPVESERIKVVLPEPVKKTSSPFVSASGRVTLDGQVLNNAKVEFVPVDENGIRISVQTNEIGQFNIASAGTGTQPGIKVAKYKIRVTTYVESRDDTVIDFLERVPAKYNSKTVLTATIAHDKKNNFDLNLSTK